MNKTFAASLASMAVGATLGALGVSELHAAIIVGKTVSGAVESTTITKHLNAIGEELFAGMTEHICAYADGKGGWTISADGKQSVDEPPSGVPYMVYPK